MAQSATKAQFVANLQSYVNLLIQAKVGLADMVNCYFQNGFNNGGSNPIANADVTANNLTAAQVAAGITLAQQLANFFGNAAVVQAEYEATVQQLRTN